MSDTNTNTNSNKSLFLYTGLIFVVAIIMIILAFFGQSNMQKNQPIQSESVSSITAKAAQLSEDNRLLMEYNQTLNFEKEQLRKENESLKVQQKVNNKEITNNNVLLETYNYIYKGQKKKARELLKTVVPEELTETQETFYNVLIKKSK